MEKVVGSLEYSADVRLKKSFDFLCRVFGHRTGALCLQIRFIDDDGNVDARIVHTQWRCFRCGEVLNDVYHSTGIAREWE